MFEALVIVTREGVEAALVVAIVLAYLRRVGRARLAPWAYGGVGSALVLSVIGALLIPRFEINQELVEGWAMLAGAVCVMSLVAWMRHAGPRMKQEIESGLEGMHGRARGAGWGVLLFVTLMVVREGIETVLFLTAISLNTDGLSRGIGSLLGLAVAVAFGVLLLRGTLRVNLQRFFAVTTVVLTVLGVQLLMGAYHEFAEAGVLPANRASMALVGPVVRYDSVIFAAVVLLVLLLLGRHSAREAAPEAANPAERRKAMARQRRERMTRRAATAVAVAVVVILGTGFLSQAQVPGIVEGAPLAVTGGEVRIPVAQVSDGRAHFFATPAGGRTVRYFVRLRPQGDLVVCLDACQICGDIGYYETSGQVICRNCVAPINPTSLGLPGGCNPIPVASAVEADSLRVSEETLVRAARYFSVAR